MNIIFVVPLDTKCIEKALHAESCPLKSNSSPVGHEMVHYFFELPFSQITLTMGMNIDSTDKQEIHF